MVIRQFAYRRESASMPRRLLFSYGVAAVMATLGLLPWLLFGTRLEPSPMPILLSAVVVAALYAGLGPGLTVTAFGTLAILFVYARPYYSFAVEDPSEVVELIVFAFLGVQASVLSALLRRAHREARRAYLQAEEYLQQVAPVIDAAAAVEAGTFQPESVAAVAQRSDALGQLARVVQHMGREVQAREHRLHQQVQQLRIEVDAARKEREVAAITETDFFQDLQAKAKALRARNAEREGVIPAPR